MSKGYGYWGIEMKKIDFVVTWVDGNDPEWRAERQKYMPVEKNTGNTEIRFRDWDLMRYWFRGVEKYAPWVNNVYFITCGHYPEWLNLDHPKLKHIKHVDYIPKELLPTYNCNVIQMRIHKIEGLSEHFVLFNDDIFLIKPVTEKDFFKNGKPVETALLSSLSANNPKDVFPYMILNNIAIINKHFVKHKVVRKNIFKFFSLRYGLQAIRNILTLPEKHFSYFCDTHVCSPYLKSTFTKVWNLEPQVLDKACSAKFRTKDDITEWLVKDWQICEGNFEPRSVRWGKAFSIGEDSQMIPAIRKQKYKAVCVNDCDPDVDFEYYKKELQAAFESILPEKSNFEKF